MAADTVVHDDVQAQGGEWDGGKSPFKASYGKLMMWYFLLSDAFTFAGFLISYGALRFSSATWPVPDYVFKTHPLGSSELPLLFVTFMSFLLIISSVTMVRAVQEGHRENKNGAAFYLFLTVLGGLGFLSCQAWEWNNLLGAEGMTIHTNPFGTHVEDGKYLSIDELSAYAQKQGWEKNEHSFTDHDGKETTLAYFLDKDGTEYYEKRDHHGHLPEEMEFHKGESYLITKSHDLHQFLPGAIQIVDHRGNTVVQAEEKGPKAFGALFFGITGFHGFHVLSGVVFLIIIMVNVASGLYMKRKNGHEMVEKIGLYWHFVDLVWVFVFLVFYLL